MKFADRKYLLKEAQRTLDESDSTAAFCLCQRWILKDAIALLKEQEAVVRCKDCKHCYFASNRVPNERSYACEKHGIDIVPDWFCADGERKE